MLAQISSYLDNICFRELSVIIIERLQISAAEFSQDCQFSASASDNTHPHKTLEK